jgi:DNA-binding Lrp family transcriptional regulator
LQPLCPICQPATSGQHRAKRNQTTMTTCVFVQIRCTPGTTYKVAEEIALREIHSELYSTSGEYDLLMKLYIPKDADVGKFINENLLKIEGIERSMTTMTFKVF